MMIEKPHLTTPPKFFSTWPILRAQNHSRLRYVFLFLFVNFVTGTVISTKVVDEISGNRLTVCMKSWRNSRQIFKQEKKVSLIQQLNTTVRTSLL